MRTRALTRLLGAALLISMLAIGAAGCKVDTNTDSDSALDTPGDTATEKSSTKDDTSTEDTADEEPDYTPGQENAIEAAQNYLDIGSMSKKGLIEQLSSKAGDGYTKAEARFAVRHVDANWKAEAVEAAKNYLDISSMSRAELLDQLQSAAGDGFTPAQAEYAVNKAYR